MCVWAAAIGCVWMYSSESSSSVCVPLLPSSLAHHLNPLFSFFYPKEIQMIFSHMQKLQMFVRLCVMSCGSPLLNSFSLSFCSDPSDMYRLLDQTRFLGLVVAKGTAVRRNTDTQTHGAINISVYIMRTCYYWVSVIPCLLLDNVQL